MGTAFVMRVVLDTNILFSALISPHGPPDAIYRAWRLARFHLVTSDAQLAEIRRASRYPKFQSILQLARVGVMVNNMQRAILLENSLLRSEGPSIRIVMQRCCNRSSKASTSALLANNSYHADGSKLVVMRIDARP